LLVSNAAMYRSVHIIIWFQSYWFSNLANECLEKCFIQYTVPTVCFHINSASRGTAVSTFEYAHQTEKILNLRSIIIYPHCLHEEETERLKSIDTETGILESGLERFRKRFGERMFSYNNKKNVSNCEDSIGGVELVTTALQLNCSILYMQKFGTKNSPPAYPISFSKSMPTAVHAIFRYERHGTYYASLNENIPFFPPHVCGTTMEDSCDEIEFLSYIVSKPSIGSTKSHALSLREELGIAPDTLVVCNHGGRGSFDLSIAAAGVNSLIAQYNSSQLHFLILGSLYGSNGTSLHYLPQISSMDSKERFFDACNCMLHARYMGETFGLAVAEFSIRNKPVLTYTGSIDQHLADQEHIRILGRKGFYYTTPEDIVNIISDWIHNGIPYRDYNAHRAYTAERIMNDFKRIFLRDIPK